MEVLYEKFSMSPVTFFMSLCMDFSSSAEDFILRQDFGNRPAINDNEQISELSSASRGAYYMDEGGYLLAFKVSNSSSYVYRFMPYENAPEFIKSKL